MHTHKTKDRVTRTPLHPWSELILSGSVGSSCWTIRTCRDNLLTNPVLNHEDCEMITTSGTYPWAFAKQILYNGREKKKQYQKFDKDTKLCITSRH